MTILHICSAEAWEAAQQAGAYRGDTLDTEGFIHCSTFEQVVAVAAKWFKGRSGLVVLAIETEKVTPEIRYEDPGNGQRYPHIYGPLNVDAVQQVKPFVAQEDGTFQQPVFDRA